MRRIKPIVARLFFAVGLLMYSFNGYATGDPEIVRIFSQAAPPPGTTYTPLTMSSVDELVDDVYYGPSSSTILNPANDKITNVISLLIREADIEKIKTDFTASVEIKIEYTLVNGSTGTINSTTLAITYTKLGGLKYNARQTFKFDQCRKVKVTILSAPVTNVTSWNVWEVINLENRMLRKRDYNFNYNSTLQLEPVATTVDLDELIINWSNSTSASNGKTHVDIEWTWIDEEAIGDFLLPNPANSNNPELNAELIFKNNSSRITVESKNHTTYNIPLIYDGKGKLFYRVRPVQLKEDEQVINGTWTAEGFTGITSYTINTDPAQHVMHLNWQTTTSFAEEGKRKTVVQYFDGTLRGRQTVTKDNVTNKTVVAESFYDYQGRPTINILPAPTMSSVIKFTDDFNKFLGGFVTPKEAFDLMPANVNACNFLTPRLDNTTGAAQYYSANNPQKTIGFNKFIPDADGFAYTETRYTPDATGRIEAQGGVGGIHQLGKGNGANDHDTKYFYGKPDQDELDALFGTEAGDATHYSKNMVRDANGQYSVSYVDMHGRTVATALAGTPPANVKALTSYVPVKPDRTKNLLSPTNNTVQGRSIISSSTILVSDAGPHVFHYELDPLSAEIEACMPPGVSVCYDCYYDLEIRITGGCDVSIVKNITNLSFSNGVPQVDQTCSTFVAPIVVDFTETLPEGEYNITKTLTVNKAAQDWYRDNVYSVHNICKTVQDFYDEIYEVMFDESSECIICTDCEIAVKGSQNVTPAGTGNKVLVTASQLSQSLIEHKLNVKSGLHNKVADAGKGETTSSVACPVPANDECSAAQTLTVNTDYSCGTVTAGTTCGATISPGTPSCLPPFNEIEEDVWYRFTATATHHRVSFLDIVGPTHHTWPIVAAYSGTCGSLNELDCRTLNTGSLTMNLSGLTVGNTYYVRVAAYQNTGLDFKICIGTPPPPVCSTYVESCISVCDQPKNTLDAIKDLMLDDMTPGHGQYARLDLDINDNGILEGYLPDYGRYESTEQRHHNIFQRNLSNYRKPFGINGLPQTSYDYYDEDGIIDPDGSDLWNMLPADFSNRFKPSWAKQLLPYHPEYCKLTIAETQLADSYRKDAIVEATDTWAEAYGLGFIENLSNPGEGTGLLDLDQFFNCGNRNEYRMKMMQYINSNFNQYLVSGQTVPPYLSLWKIAWSTVFCDDHTSVPTPASECAYNAPLKPADFPYFSNVCTADKDQVWRIYKSLFLSEKERMVNEWLNTQCNIDYATIDGNANNHYERRFGKPADYYTSAGYLQTLINGASTTSHDSDAEAMMEAEYQETCKSYKAVWANSLRQCSVIKALDVIVNNQPVIDPVTGLTQNAFISTILNNLINICVDGSDDTHPMGSSSVKTGSTLIPASFQDAFNAAWTAHFGSTPQTVYCHENLIDFPQPYGKQSPISDETIDEKKDNCVCSRLTELTTEKNLDLTFMNNSPNTSLSAYLLYKHGTVVRQSLIDSLTAGCTNNSCTYYESAVVIPPILSCENPVKNCVDCELFRSLLTEFKSKYSTLSAGAIYANPANDDQLAANKAFAKFMNNKTGLTKSWGEYLAFNNQYDGECYFMNGVEGVFTLDPPKLCRDIMFPSVEVKDSCNQYVKTLALNAAIEQHQIYVTQQNDLFDNTYLTSCLAAKDLEKFTVSSKVSEYHYTLYYYDQAGNLVKTVPPAGVNANFTQTHLDAVKYARAHNQDVLMAHSLPTQYRYNALNQVTKQKSPDGGQSQFWYDDMGRLVVSQNAKQLAHHKYSYTLYDDLGRITEVGEKNKQSGHTVMTQAIAQNSSSLLSWLAASGSEPNKNITKTVYDEEFNPICAQNYMCQQNLRNRVSYTYVQATDNGSSMVPPWQSATFYTYDIHGHVDVLLQDYFGLLGAVPGGNRYKKITYKYDLISGKVNEVAYQPGYADAFYHRYEYDAENKLTETYTSKEQVYWEQEASYKYYRHGPLARTVLGQLNVQGVDYAYTLQGWLKGVNTTGGLQGSGFIGNGEDCGPNSAVENLYVYNRQSPFPLKYVARTSVTLMPSSFESTTPDNFEVYTDPLLAGCGNDGNAGDETNSPNNNAAFDMGQDGKTSSLGVPVNTSNPTEYGNNTRTTDAYGYSLNYFNGDYNRIDQTTANPFAALNMPLPTGDAGTPNTANQLFNGNIGAMVVSIPKLGTAKVYGYNYDQLNRITNMFAFNGINNATNTFTPIALNDYKEAVTYDPNGNILTYQRNGASTVTPGGLGGLNMDDLAYEYIPNSNKLKRVTDNPAYNSNYPNDIDNQTDANNYVYDEIGNLIQDKAEGITNIEWNVYGKIASITKGGGPGNMETNIYYTYDASGNRISKSVQFTPDRGLPQNQTTYYVRDASGNVMSIYVNGDNTLNAGELTQTEVHLYGSSRLGVYNVKVNVQTESRSFVTMTGVTANTGELVTFTRGNKFFELSNHLGNVLVTVSDKKIVYDATNDGIAEYYSADVITANDYYPFGMQMPGRKFTNSTSGYRYGFNGQEKSSDVVEGNYTAEYWEYDSRIGRRWNVDPIVKEYESPYNCFSGNPILYSDPKGNTSGDPIDPKGQPIKLPKSAIIINLNTASNVGPVKGTDDKVQAQAVEGSIGEFSIGDRIFSARYNKTTGEFTRYADQNSISFSEHWDSDDPAGDVLKQYANNIPLRFVFGVSNVGESAFSFFSNDIWKGQTWVNIASGFEQKVLSTSTVKIAPTPIADVQADRFIKNVVNGSAGDRSEWVGELFGNYMLGRIASPSATTSTAMSANDYAIDAAVRASMGPSKGGIPNTITAMTSKDLLSFGTNGSHFPTNIASNLGTPLFSRTPWAVLQCAEPKALNIQLLHGVERSQISYATYGIKSGSVYQFGGLNFRGTGSIFMKAPCPNCTITLSGLKKSF